MRHIDALMLNGDPRAMRLVRDCALENGALPAMLLDGADKRIPAGGLATGAGYGNGRGDGHGGFERRNMHANEMLLDENHYADFDDFNDSDNDIGRYLNGVDDGADWDNDPSQTKGNILRFEVRLGDRED